LSYRKRSIFDFIKKLVSSPKSPDSESGFEVYPRSAHTVSRAQISDNALKVLYRLKSNGYQSYLVGGCVRDLLLGLEPKDFDVVTDASPEQVKAIFRNCRLIGRRFRLAHVHFGREIIEVATFRGASGDDGGGIGFMKMGVCCVTMFMARLKKMFGGEISRSMRFIIIFVIFQLSITLMDLKIISREFCV